MRQIFWVDQLQYLPAGELHELLRRVAEHACAALTGKEIAIFQTVVDIDKVWARFEDQLGQLVTPWSHEGKTGFWSRSHVTATTPACERWVFPVGSVGNRTIGCQLFL